MNSQPVVMGSSKPPMSYERKIELFRKARFAILLLLILGVLLQIAGFCTPGWVVTSVGSGALEQTMQRGLWYFVYCLDESCDTKPFGDLDDYPHYELHDNGLVEYQVEATFALTCILLALLFLVISYRSSDFFFKHILMVVMAICALVSGALAITAVSRIGDATIDADDRLGDLSPFDAPYSLVLTGIGGILAVIVFFIFVFAICCCKPSTERMVTKTKLKYVPQPIAQPYHSTHTSEQVVYVEKPRPVPQPYNMGPPPSSQGVVYIDKPRQPSSIGHQYGYPAAPRSISLGPEEYDVRAPEPYHVKLQVLSADEISERYSSAGSTSYRAGSTSYRAY